MRLIILVFAAFFLVSAASARPAVLRAEIAGPKAVWVITEGVARRFSPEGFTLETAGGEPIAVADVLASTASRTLLVPAETLDIRRVHYLTAYGQRVRVRFDGWFRSLYSPKELGATVGTNGEHTDIRLFAPRAHEVTVSLYDSKDGDTVFEAAMVRDQDGVWEYRLPGDHAGTWYDFMINGPAEPGSRSNGRGPVRVSDPYARVSDDSFGRAMIARALQPAPPLRGGRPAMEDVIAYEVHIQDFTDLLPVAGNLQGTIPAMTLPGLTNANGAAVGFDHLKQLGVNVVHLMPVQEYLHYPDQQWREAFGTDPDMARLGIADENYQWGYRTTHAFAVESRYRQRGTPPGAERVQFRDLVAAFHENDMAVIIDIVPNHTGENMDGQNFIFNFNGIDRYYYYRTDDDGAHIGPYGNEVKTEDRPMVQRWIIDQALHFVEEFGVDGFRIDLAGQIDEQTLIALKAALPDDIILYGEPWIDVTDPVVRANPDWDWYKADSPITFFQDTARDAMKGSPFQLEVPHRDNGFAGGNGTLREAVMRALENSYEDEAEGPHKGLNYLDIHDNWSLSDRFATSGFDGRGGVDADRFKIAATLLMTGQGPVVLHGGVEILRSKGLAELEGFDRRAPFGRIVFKGRDDTYNQRAPNRFIWSGVGANGSDGPLDIADMTAFWQGLIALRRSEVGRVFRQRGPVPAGHYDWILPDEATGLGYRVGGQILVLLNPGQRSVCFSDVFGDDRWRAVVAENRFISTPSGCRRHAAGGSDVTLEAAGVEIWVRCGESAQ